MADLQPQGDRVLIEADKPVEKTDSGFFINEDWKSLPPLGTVLAVGPQVAQVKAGDRVIFERYASIMLEGQLRLCKESHILSRVTGE